MGGTSYLILSFGIVRVNFFVTLDVAQATLSNSAFFDVVTYSQFCLKSSLFSDIARLIIQLRIDILECEQGFLDLIFYGKGTGFCSWRDNFIDYPLFD
jgi:hypothetical protein